MERAIILLMFVMLVAEVFVIRGQYRTLDKLGVDIDDYKDAVFASIKHDIDEVIATIPDAELSRTETGRRLLRSRQIDALEAQPND